MRVAKVLIVFASMVLSACQTIEPSTPSVRPEVTISASAAEVKAAFVAVMLNLDRSMLLARDSDFQVVLESPLDSFRAIFVSRTDLDPVSEQRFTATLLNLGARQTQIFVDLAIVRNGGTAREQISTNINSEDGIEIQNILNDIKAGLEAGLPVGRVVADAVTAVRSRFATTA